MEPADSRRPAERTGWAGGVAHKNPSNSRNIHQTAKRLAPNPKSPTPHRLVLVWCAHHSCYMLILTEISISRNRGMAAEQTQPTCCTMLVEGVCCYPML